ncbi:MAG: hypothetical protein HKN16_02145 [Saprospiraceae bacterium]|nr:hypothetical protein [Saprospiraceae bacterium]
MKEILLVFTILLFGTSGFTQISFGIKSSIIISEIDPFAERGIFGKAGTTPSIGGIIRLTRPGGLILELDFDYHRNKCVLDQEEGNYLDYQDRFLRGYGFVTQDYLRIPFKVGAKLFNRWDILFGFGPGFRLGGYADVEFGDPTYWRVLGPVSKETFGNNGVDLAGSGSLEYLVYEKGVNRLLIIGRGLLYISKRRESDSYKEPAIGLEFGLKYLFSPSESESKKR